GGLRGCGVECAALRGAVLEFASRAGGPAMEDVAGRGAGRGVESVTALAAVDRESGHIGVVDRFAGGVGDLRRRDGEGGGRRGTSGFQVVGAAAGRGPTDGGFNLAATANVGGGAG